MSSRRTVGSHAILWSLLSVLACTGADPAGSETVGSEGATRLDATASPQAAPATGIPRELLDRMIADLAERIGAAPSSISVASAERVTWNDGGLGCPQPGAVYTQQLVPGFRVMLAAGESRYAYHAAAAGFFVFCTSPLAGAPIQGPRPPVTLPPDR